MNELLSNPKMLVGIVLMITGILDLILGPMLLKKPSRNLNSSDTDFQISVLHRKKVISIIRAVSAVSIVAGLLLVSIQSGLTPVLKEKTAEPLPESQSQSNN